MLPPRNVVMFIDSVGEIVDSQGVVIGIRADNKIKNEEIVRTGINGTLKIKLLGGAIVKLKPNSSISFHISPEMAEQYKYNYQPNFES